MRCMMSCKRTFERIVRSILLMSIVLYILFTNNQRTLADEMPSVISFDGTYTYDRMVYDAQVLSIYYPDVISLSFEGQTALGRQILIMKLGNPGAPVQILVHASIHAREYYVTPLVMKMAEYYAANEKELLQSVCFTIVPMANPDGVSIAQFGASAASDINYQTFINYLGHFGMWKANANGVDINRNFPTGWGNAKTKSDVNSYAYYGGTEPSTEVETLVLENLLLENNFNAYIAYHMRGNVIYFYAPMCSPEIFAASKLIATTIHNTNGYRIIVDADEETPNGSFADFAQIVCNVPGCTIECGTKLPPNGASAQNSFYTQNLMGWKNVAGLFLQIK